MTNSETKSGDRTMSLIGHLVVPFAVAILIALAGIVVLLWVAARGQDEIAARSSRNIMQALTENVARDMEHLVYDNSWWDIAIENLIANPDADWADANIGSYATETFDVTESYVLSADDRTLFAFKDGVASEETITDHFGSTLSGLIKAARAAPMEEPKAVSTYVVSGGELHLIAANALTPEEPTPEQLEPAARPVLIYSRHVSPDRLVSFSERFEFANLTFSTVLPQAEPYQNVLALKDLAGTSVAWLVWDPPRPGTNLFSSVLPWLVAGVLVLLALSVLFVRRVVGMARRMVADARNLAKMDRQLAQSSKLAVLGEMAAGLVHELNQPLNIIRMTADMTRDMMDRSRGEVPDNELREQLDVIGGQSRRMGETIQSMRIFSRDDYGRKIAFDPVQATSKALSWIRNDFSERNIEVTFQAPAHCGRVYGEPSRFEQVIVNLLMNARDAIESRYGHDGEAGGQVRISVSEDSSLRHVIVAVRDNGGGVPGEYLDRLFDPFFTTKAPGEGTGLGLSISYGIILGMGGELSAHNEAEGAAFLVTFPRIAPDVSDEPVAREDAA